MDRLRRVPHLPPLGGYAEVQDESIMLGGEAANTANALVKWGVEVKLSGNRLGGGLEGRVLRGMLDDKGLSKSLISNTAMTDSTEDCLTPVCDIYVTPDGERTMFGRGFSTMDLELSIETLPFEKGQFFTAEPNMEQASREVVRAAIAAGMRPYLMDFIRPSDPIVPGSYWQSSTDWAGFKNNTQKNVQWVKDWVTRYGCFTILSDGPNGFVAGAPSMPARSFPPYPAASVVDTTGAGDMFRAGMLFGLENNWPIGRCLQFAAAAGCLKCSALGATTMVPTVDQVLAYVEEFADVSRLYV